MKPLFFALSLLALVASSTSASADHGGPDGPPGWGGDHGGPGWGGGGPGWGGGHGGPGWGPGGPGWGGPGHGGPGHGGPGWGGPGHGYPPPPPPPPPRQQYVQCESGGYRTNICYVNGYIRGAQIVRQDSMAACNLGQSWGYQQNSVWVSNGCRGTFLVYLY